ncbi:OsmC family protein [Gordonia sihwensis]|uniref:OsmC family protein n=1 Tax=Gordonia TaxID=2053 RepID=UPI002416FAEC|nr:OsmC family protein [Gordonia sihwensis]WFN93373.1 OsmC family protein [Gordonia sihwensis]
MTTTQPIDIPDSRTPLNSIAAATADAVAARASNAQVVFGASAVATAGVSSEVSLRSFSVRVDEPPTLGGSDSAPNPVEYYLAALLSCQVVTYRFWAERLGVEFDDLTLSAEGDLDVRGFFGLDADVRPGFTAVRVIADISGPASDGDYQRLQETVERHCPVQDLTVNATPVTTELRIAR